MAGQIINRGKNTWLVRVFLGRSPETGKREYSNKTVHGNKRDAENELTDLLKARYTGALALGAKKLLVGVLLADVLQDYKNNGKDAAWAEIVIANLLPTFEKLPISAIRVSHVDKYIGMRRAAGRKNATINHELSMLRRSFNLARKKGIIGAVPFHIEALEENNVRKGFFEHSDYRALRDKLPDELKAVLTFAYYTGCRKAEILGLKWGQVDLIHRMIRLEVGETKNKQSRILPLQVEELYQTIALQRAQRDQLYPESAYVFSRAGMPIKNFRKSWETACQAAGLWDPEKEKPTKLFHDLRRTGVRNLIRAGVPEKVAMLISGHRTRAVFERYNIVDERDVIAAMGRLDVYTRERAEAETQAETQGTLSNRHTMGTQTKKRPISRTPNTSATN